MTIQPKGVRFMNLKSSLKSNIIEKASGGLAVGQQWFDISHPLPIFLLKMHCAKLPSLLKHQLQIELLKVSATDNTWAQNSLIGVYIDYFVASNPLPNNRLGRLNDKRH